MLVGEDVARYWSREEAVLSEYAQFAGVMVLFVAILLGSYFFVFSPDARQNGPRPEGGREDC
jgi:hypothetical protein